MTETPPPLLSFPREALPRFLKALESRTTPASEPYPFIPDDSLRCTVAKNGFSLRINTVNQSRSYTGHVQFVEETDRLRIRLELEPDFTMQALPVVAGVGFTAFFTFALASGAPLEFMAMALPMGAFFFLIQRTIRTQASQDAKTRFEKCLLECVLEAERSNSVPPQSHAVPSQPMP